MGQLIQTSRVTRRQSLQVGGLSLLGLSLGDLSALRAIADEKSSAAKHRPNSCVFIFLFGGPSHIDLWDMKPEAPAEISACCDQRARYSSVRASSETGSANGQALPAAVDDSSHERSWPGM